MTRFTAKQLEAIRVLFEVAETHGMSLWLENGWAIDARVGRVTRDHEDIDIAYPRDRERDYFNLIGSLGYTRHEQTDYGTLSWRGDILLDSEPCQQIGDEYNFAGYPRGSCPRAKEGDLGGCRLRCVSWEALYYEILGNIRDIPQENWRAKDYDSLRLVEAHLSEQSRRELRERFAREPGRP